MPTIVRVGQYRFFFYSEEGNEDPHLHIEAAEKRAKFWVEAKKFAWNDGFRSGELKEIEQIISDNINSILEAWYEFFAGE